MKSRISRRKVQIEIWWVDYKTARQSYPCPKRDKAILDSIRHRTLNSTEVGEDQVSDNEEASRSDRFVCSSSHAPLPVRP